MPFLRPLAAFFALTAVLFACSSYDAPAPIDAGCEGSSCWVAPAVTGHKVGDPFPIPAPGASGNILQSNGNAWTSATNSGGGGTVPTGTGFPHITSGAQDPASRAVNVATSDITGIASLANGGTGLSTTSLTTGNTLQAVSSSAIGYGALNVAGGANYVTGVLPSANGGTGTSSSSTIQGTAPFTINGVNTAQALFAANTLAIANASLSSAGVVTTGTQSFAGDKTYSGTIRAPSSAVSSGLPGTPLALAGGSGDGAALPAGAQIFSGGTLSAYISEAATDYYAMWFGPTAAASPSFSNFAVMVYNPTGATYLGTAGSTTLSVQVGSVTKVAMNGVGVYLENGATDYDAAAAERVCPSATSCSIGSTSVPTIVKGAEQFTNISTPATPSGGPEAFGASGALASVGTGGAVYTIAPAGNAGSTGATHQWPATFGAVATLGSSGVTLANITGATLTIPSNTVMMVHARIIGRCTSSGSSGYVVGDGYLWEGEFIATNISGTVTFGAINSTVAAQSVPTGHADIAASTPGATASGGTIQLNITPNTTGGAPQIGNVTWQGELWGAVD